MRLLGKQGGSAFGRRRLFPALAHASSCPSLLASASLRSASYTNRFGRAGVAFDIGRPADAPDEHGVPGQHRGATRSDGDQTGKDAVAQRAWYGNTGLMQVLYRSGPVLRR